MESLVPFLSNGLGYDPISAPSYRSEVFIPMDYVHRFIVYLNRPLSVQMSPEIKYNFCSFVHNQVRVSPLPAKESVLLMQREFHRQVS